MAGLMEGMRGGGKGRIREREGRREEERKEGEAMNSWGGQAINSLSLRFLFPSMNHICTDVKMYSGSCWFRARHEEGAE